MARPSRLLLKMELDIAITAAHFSSHAAAGCLGSRRRKSWLLGIESAIHMLHCKALGLIRLMQ